MEQRETARREQTLSAVAGAKMMIKSLTWRRLSKHGLPPAWFQCLLLGIADRNARLLSVLLTTRVSLVLVQLINPTRLPLTRLADQLQIPQRGLCRITH